MEGRFIYNGYPIHQPPDVVECFRTFFTKEKPDTIIEIGTAFGGLTMVLHDTSDAPIHTFDITGLSYIRGNSRITHYTMDVLSEEGKQKIAELIQTGGKVLLLCDGGNKVGEFNEFAPRLKPGDMIMAHDYEGRSCKDWIWVEVHYDDVVDAMEDGNFSLNLQSVMEKAAWISCKKYAP